MGEVSSLELKHVNHSEYDADHHDDSDDVEDVVHIKLSNLLSCCRDRSKAGNQLILSSFDSHSFRL